MDYKLVYDRYQKKFLTPNQYMGILIKLLKNSRYPKKIECTSNGIRATYAAPNYLLIIGNKHLPKDTIVEKWIVLEAPRESLNGPSSLIPRVACLDFAYDGFFFMPCMSVEDSRRDYFCYKGCVPLCLDGVQVSTVNFMSNVSKLKKIASELF